MANRGTAEVAARVVVKIPRMTVAVSSTIATVPVALVAYHNTGDVEASIKRLASQ